jgi:N-methylhydantoinase A
VDEDLVTRLIQTFSNEHAREYGYTMPPHIARIEIANVRLAAVGKVEQPTIGHQPPVGAPTTPQSQREVFYGGSGFVQSAIYWRETLTRDQRITGPAIIEQADSTTVIPPGWDAVMDDAGNLRVNLVRAG